jgi:uncharacterized protein with von Willebrand factor type A (vWA) domain
MAMRPRRGHGRSSRYSSYTGGPDPLAPPVDLREALEQIGQDVMEGSSPRRALSELLRRGTQNMRGADKLAAEANRRRRELLQRNNLDGTLQEIKKLLDEAVLAERKELARALDDDARFQEMRIESLPRRRPRPCRNCPIGEWRSPRREKYEQIKDLLGREMLDQRFAGMKQALENATDEDRQRVNEMLDDLNDLLDKHARGQDSQQDFDDFMNKHGEFFPENPRNVEELLDSLAKRAAAAQRFRNSLSADQRAELDALAQQAFGSPSLMNALNRLDGHLQAARPGEDWSGSSRFSGDNPMGMGEGTQALSDIAELEQLAEALSQSYAGATMDDVDLDALARQLGDEAVVDARTLTELERALVNQGFLDRGSDGQWRLSPKAMRQLGQTALRDVAQQLSSRHGERDNRRAGAAGELTGATRPWQFGDTEPWNVTRTLANAVLRQAGTGAMEEPIHITVDDVEVSETETRAQAAVALLVDTSFSMVMENRWLPMKRTALALNHLVSTRFRSDALQIIAFGRTPDGQRRRTDRIEVVYEQGTNLHHALALAGGTCAAIPTRSRSCSSSLTANPLRTWRISTGKVRVLLCFLITHRTRGRSPTPYAASTTWPGWARRSPSSGSAPIPAWPGSSTRSRAGSRAGGARSMASGAGSWATICGRAMAVPGEARSAERPYGTHTAHCGIFGDWWKHAARATEVAGRVRRGPQHADMAAEVLRGSRGARRLTHRYARSVGA